MNRIETLRAEIAELAGAMKAIVDAAEEKGWTPEAQAAFDEKDKILKDKQGQLDRLSRLQEVSEKLNGIPRPKVEPPAPPGGYTNSTEPPAPSRPSITGGSPVAWTYANHGFTQGPGEFLAAVRASAISNTRDQRLMVNAITTYAGEVVGADGGFALPPQFVQGIMSLAMPGESFLQALNPITTTSDILSIPADEDAPWSTAAVTAAITAEAGQITASKIALKPIKVVLYGIKSLVHVDEKALRDMAFLGSYVQRKMGEKIRWKMENYVINGTGEDQPLGFLYAPGLVLLTDVNSTASAIGPEDFMAMKAASLEGPGGFWVCHPLVQPMIWAVKSGTGGYPLYTTDMRSPTGGTLLGAPVYVSEACKALNTSGDIYFVKPSGYVLALEAGGIQSATTISYAFDQNLQSFRSTLYMGGAPTLSAKVLRADATNYASNIIGLTGSRS